MLVATRGLFSAAGAGFMMIDDTSMLRFVAATHELGRLLESRQQEIGHGPCVDSLTFDRVICTSDLARPAEWSGSEIDALQAYGTLIEGLLRTAPAFNKLRNAARSSERKVADVPAELLARIPGNRR